MDSSFGHFYPVELEEGQYMEDNIDYKIINDY